MQQEFNIRELDVKKIKKVVEGAFEDYRYFKNSIHEEKEATITASYNERFHGPTNETSDQTADVAIYNVDGPAARKAYCEKIERAVNSLYQKERLLITERYMKDEYMNDLKVYSFIFNPPISKETYSKIREKAFYRLALRFDDLRLLEIKTLYK